ncbi:MBL fold metallo-hydrolase [Hydrogenoanaerobacterium sp.]|uniref:MBL fold metallo-hydrolase n=1 Tax=Hydrogenoanaerobacterium sp. TaxID=2953763 RepID=UPI00289EE98A|nr:MBL fold metallo-hydrolase [Hydrogenoanaerobacterium sp.]
MNDDTSVGIPVRTFVTNVPDKAGAFLLANRIILQNGGNIMRVSYNKAVDLHTMFIDVQGSTRSLDAISQQLQAIGYLGNCLAETQVMMVELKIPDEPGALYPVLKILDRYDINISYINSSPNGTPYQNFRMGLLIENPKVVKLLLDDISEHCPIDILEYDASEASLDNTIFYIRLANDMQKMFYLSAERTMEFISEANRILQLLQDRGENPQKVFDYIHRFAAFIKRYEGEQFQPDVNSRQVSAQVTLHTIEPPCGSNTYVLETQDELVLIDTGFAVYAREMLALLRRLFPDWAQRKKRIFITHADVDHCGLLNVITDAELWLNRKSAESLRLQWLNQPDFRERKSFCMGYSKLSRIITSYQPPEQDRFYLIDDETTPEEHEDLLKIGAFTVGDLDFEVFEGSGGHLYGEMIFLCRAHSLIFTGDNLVNISGFSFERAEFNSLAPYLMTSVNVDSKRATAMRRQVISLIEQTEQQTGSSCLILGGHGPHSRLREGKLVTAE